MQAVVEAGYVSPGDENPQSFPLPSGSDIPIGRV
jgi:hypothetical protein